MCTRADNYTWKCRKQPVEVSKDFYVVSIADWDHVKMIIYSTEGQTASLL
jgi:hypothetical protein